MNEVFFSIALSLDGYIVPKGGGETGPDNVFLEPVFARTGASVMGKQMFDGGERFWPQEAPFHTVLYAQ